MGEFVSERSGAAAPESAPATTDSLDRVGPIRAAPWGAAERANQEAQ
jgi:hypothetical protein